MIKNNQILHELQTFRDMARWGASQFNAAGLHFGHGNTNAWDEALYLIRHVLHLSPSEDMHVADAQLLLSEREAIANLFERRIRERKPAPYLTQQAWFSGLPFYVDERVIIPRSPMTELIEQAFSPWVDQDPKMILDLCTGSGCIAVVCALTFPDAHIDAVDISQDALAVAKKNIAHYQLDHRVQLIESDLFANMPQQTYSVIICNPPYVDAKEMSALPPEYQHEPTLALAGGDDGLQIVQRILEQAANYLTPDGILMVEVGESEQAARARFSDYPMTWLTFERGGHGVFLLTREQL
jgi:ribosomal protein L3 glutamine methyltransferase